MSKSLVTYVAGLFFMSLQIISKKLKIVFCGFP